MQKKVIGLKNYIIKREKKKKGRRRKKKKERKLTELQKPNIEEVVYNNKKCD